MKWDDVKAAFYVDGSLRDIYITGTTASDWAKFLKCIQQYKTRHFVNGKLVDTLSGIVGFPAKDDHTHMVAIYLENLQVNCHFFTEDEIEMSIDPRQVSTQRDLDAVLLLMERIGFALRKDVTLTDENAPFSVWFKYRHLARDIVWDVPNALD